MGFGLQIIVHNSGLRDVGTAFLSHLALYQLNLCSPGSLSFDCLAFSVPQVHTVPSFRTFILLAPSWICLPLVFPQKTPLIIQTSLRVSRYASFTPFPVHLVLSSFFTPWNNCLLYLLISHFPLQNLNSMRSRCCLLRLRRHFQHPAHLASAEQASNQYFLSRPMKGLPRQERKTLIVVVRFPFEGLGSFICHLFISPSFMKCLLCVKF